MRHIQGALARLSKERQANAEEVNAAFNELERCLTSDSDSAFKNWRRITATEVSFVLYNCGKLAHRSRQGLSAEALNKLLNCLYYKAISTAFVGLEKLSREKNKRDAGC